LEDEIVADQIEHHFHGDHWFVDPKVCDLKVCDLKVCDNSAYSTMVAALPCPSHNPSRE
jgi:hypothetical protein